MRWSWPARSSRTSASAFAFAVQRVAARQFSFVQAVAAADVIFVDYAQVPVGRVVAAGFIVAQMLTMGLMSDNAMLERMLVVIGNAPSAAVVLTGMAIGLYGYSLGGDVSIVNAGEVNALELVQANVAVKLSGKSTLTLGRYTLDLGNRRLPKSLGVKHDNAARSIFRVCSYRKNPSIILAGATSTGGNYWFPNNDPFLKRVINCLI